jgi:hypothetical protein
LIDYKFTLFCRVADSNRISREKKERSLRGKEKQKQKNQIKLTGSISRRIFCSENLDRLGNSEMRSKVKIYRLFSGERRQSLFDAFEKRKNLEITQMTGMRGSWRVNQGSKLTFIISRNSLKIIESK